MRLENYVTSTEDNVYAIKNIPTEVVGTVFAKVSRSPYSFRESLYDLIKEDIWQLPDVDMISMWKQSAAYSGGFMKEWEARYGHPSIREHAVAQFCIEGVSRWFTEVLATVQAAKWLSFTEFNMQNQKSQAFVIPKELDDHPTLKERYIRFGEGCFEKYAELIPLFVDVIKKKHPDRKDGDIEKLAYEKARNVLPLATKSNVAVTGNARAISDAIAEMFAHEGYSQEVVEIAAKIKAHTAEVLPSLLRDTEATPYLRSYTAEFYKRRTSHVDILPIYNGPFVEVEEAFGLSYTYAKDIVLGDMAKMNRCSELPTVLRAFGKGVAIICSEGCHHQIIRHRAFDFSLQLPDTYYGLIIPSEAAGASDIPEAGRIIDILLSMRDQSHQLYNELVDAGLSGIAPYVVLNANARRLPLYANLYGLSHFVTLRKEVYAQDEIRSVASQLERVFQEEEQALSGFTMDRHHIK